MSSPTKIICTMNGLQSTECVYTLGQPGVAMAPPLLDVVDYDSSKVASASPVSGAGNQALEGKTETTGDV